MPDDDDDMMEATLHTIAVPTGRWVRRVDERSGWSPIMAYGMGSCVFVVWSDGSHTTMRAEARLPASNWEVVE